MDETFYDAQRRHRRAGWRFTALTVVGVVVTSLPVAVVLSPPLTALVIVVADLLSVVLPAPDLVADVVDLFRHVSGGDAWGTPTQPLTAGLVLTVVALALVPGLLVVLAGWLTVRRLFLRAGPEAVVLASGARRPKPDDLEERQLVNLVEETAIAAGVPPPQVRILDTGAVNAAIVGRSGDDAIVVVPRSLLDQLGRRPTAAVVADLVATAVDGDLRVALSIAATAQTIGLLSGVLAAPLDPRARHTLGEMLRLARRRPQPGAGLDAERDREAHFIVDELVGFSRLRDVDVDSQGQSTWRQALTLPSMLGRVALLLLELVVLGLLVSPAMAMLWRRRRLLADATAVELTRDPDGLIAALEHLQVHGASVAAGPWSHLFVVGPELERDRLQRRYEEQYEAINQTERHPDESRLAAFLRRRRARGAAQADYQQAAARTPTATAQGGDLNLVAFLPPVEQRIQRLVAVGGTRTTTPYRRTALGKLTRLGPAYAAVLVVLVPLLAALTVLLLAASLAIALLSAAMEYAVLGPVVALVHTLVR